MCNVHIPSNAYIEQHINCYLCRNVATCFLIYDEYATTEQQAKVIGNMRDDIFNKALTVDAKGNGQFSYNISGTSIPWFAENPNKILMLKPICSGCQELLTSQYGPIKPSPLEHDYIHCHHAFNLFTLQKRRFGSGEPYPPYIRKGL